MDVPVPSKLHAYRTLLRVSACRFRDRGEQPLLVEWLRQMCSESSGQASFDVFRIGTAANCNSGHGLCASGVAQAGAQPWQQFQTMTVRKTHVTYDQIEALAFRRAQRAGGSVCSDDEMTVAHQQAL